VSAAAGLDAGMRRMLERARRAREAGAARAGWKIGLNLPAVQRRLGLGASVVCALDGARVLRSGARLPLALGARLAVEAEVAIRVGADGAPGAMAPALEIVDPSRATPDLAALLEGGVLHRATVLGEERPPPAQPVRAFAPRITLHAPGRAATAGDWDESGWPASFEALLAHATRFLERWGEALRPGDLLLSGSFTRPLAVGAGDRVEAIFPPLGGVALELVAEEPPA
jgi:2-keto-4-pentenoate hydratase